MLRRPAPDFRIARQIAELVFMRPGFAVWRENRRPSNSADRRLVSYGPQAARNQRQQFR